MKKILLLTAICISRLALNAQDLKYNPGDTAYYLIVKNTPEKTDYINLAGYPLVFDGFSRNPVSVSIGGELSIFYKRLMLEGGGSFAWLDPATSNRKVDRNTAFSFYSADNKTNGYYLDGGLTYYFLDRVVDSYFKVISQTKPRGATTEYKISIPAKIRDMYGLRFGASWQRLNVITELPFIHLKGYDKNTPGQSVDGNTLYDFDRVNYNATVMHVGLELMRVSDLEYYLDKTTVLQVDRVYQRSYVDFLFANNVDYTDARRYFYNNAKLMAYSDNYELNSASPKIMYGFRIGYEIMGLINKRSWNTSLEAGSYPGPGAKFTDGLGLRMKVGFGITKRQKY